MVPDCPDKRGLSVVKNEFAQYNIYLFNSLSIRGLIPKRLKGSRIVREYITPIQKTAFKPEKRKRKT